jgi:hypothetical protein
LCHGIVIEHYTELHRTSVGRVTRRSAAPDSAESAFV